MPIGDFPPGPVGDVGGWRCFCGVWVNHGMPHSCGGWSPPAFAPALNVDLTPWIEQLRQAQEKQNALQNRTNEVLERIAAALDRLSR